MIGNDDDKLASTISDAVRSLEDAGYNAEEVFKALPEIVSIATDNDIDLEESAMNIEYILSCCKV